MEKTKKEIKNYLNTSIDKLVLEKKKIKSIDTSKLASYAKKSNEFLNNYKSKIKSIINKNGIINKEDISDLESYTNDIMAKRIMEIPPISLTQ